MFYNLPLQIQTIEGALYYKIAPLTLWYILKTEPSEKIPVESNTPNTIFFHYMY